MVRSQLLFAEVMANTYPSPPSDTGASQRISQLCQNGERRNAARRVKCPRSSGCRMCVGRRVKCDRSRPVCYRCQKAGLQCDGPPIIQQHTIETPKSMAILVRSRPQRCLSQYSSGNKPNPYQAISTIASHSVTIEANLSTGPLLEDACRNFFLERYFASSRREGHHQANKEWMIDFFAHKEAHSASVLALRSLSRSYFARIHQTERLQQQAMQLYSQALTALASDLRDPSRALDFDTLAATSLLEIYECVNFTSRAGWIQHCQGAAQLLLLRGPQRLQDARERAVFAMIRHFLVLEAMQSKSRTFLEEQAWIDVLTPAGVDIPLGVQLTSIFTRVPGLVERTVTLESGSYAHIIGANEQIESLRQDFYSVLTDLRQWHCRWQENPSRLPKECEALDSSVLFPGEVRPFIKDLQYERLELAASTIFWHVYMIFTLRWLNKVESFLAISESPRNIATATPKSNSQPDPSAYPQDRQLPLKHDLHPHAWEICRSVPYFLSSRHVYQGSHYITPAARTALRTFPPDSPVAKWMLEVLHLIARQNGFELARGFLAD